MHDGLHFEVHADVYGGARPPYPVELWNTVRDLGVLEPGSSVVDLGAGTGQATGLLLGAGMRVTAVEPGPQLAARIRSAFAAATVVQDRAETATLPEWIVELDDNQVHRLFTTFSDWSPRRWSVQPPLQLTSAAGSWRITRHG